MLRKLFGFRTNKPSIRHRRHPPPPPASTVEDKPAAVALKIIHAGGMAECYYMAVPAAMIMEKYPSFVLARPEVFCRPWDSVVRPEEILIPGQKLFVIPCRTLKKLRRRISKTCTENTVSSQVSSTDISPSTASTTTDVSSQFVSQRNNEAMKKLLRRIKKSDREKTVLSSVEITPYRTRTCNRLLRIDKKPDKGTMEKKKVNGEHDLGKNPSTKTRGRYSSTWQPTLAIINE